MSNNSREETYCVKERKYTKNINPIIKTSKNGNNYIQSTCFVCGNKKSSFIKSLKNNQQQNKKNGNGSNNEKSKSKKKNRNESNNKKNGNGSNNGKSKKILTKKNNNTVNIKDFFYKKNKK